MARRTPHALDSAVKLPLASAALGHRHGRVSSQLRTSQCRPTTTSINQCELRCRYSCSTHIFALTFDLDLVPWRPTSGEPWPWPRSTLIYTIFSTKNRSFLPICFPSSLINSRLISVNQALGPNLSNSYSTIPLSATSSINPLALSFRLIKFCKSFPT